MNLHSPDRPTLPNGRKALLLDGSAVPAVSVTVNEDATFDLCVFLRHPGAGEAYNYAPHHVAVASLDQFFLEFAEDPEATLKLYFNWTPSVVRRPTTATRSAPRVVADGGAVLSSLDLL